MVETKEKHLQYDKAIGDFLGIVKCLLVIADIKSYKVWFNKSHLNGIGSNHLSGYKLLFNTLFRMLVSELESNVSLGLTSDDIFDRASFREYLLTSYRTHAKKLFLLRIFEAIVMMSLIHTIGMILRMLFINSLLRS